MPFLRIHKDSKVRIHFVTFTVQKWYYVFDRHNRWQMLADSLQHCQQHKGLKIYAYVFMLNHVHLLCSSPDLSALIRDFKKFTSKQIIQNIIATEPQVLELFPLQNEKRKFWQETNFPEYMESEELYFQKLSYIHNNPVKKEYVELPEHWRWSSANPHQPITIANPFEG